MGGTEGRVGIDALVAEGRRIADIAAKDEFRYPPVLREQIRTLADALERQQAVAYSLFDAIKHGDDEHQAWLREAIANHFAGLPIPLPRGKGNKEKMQAVVEAARKCWKCADDICDRIDYELVDSGQWKRLGPAVFALEEALAALDAPPEGDG